ncbi:uncharacterized protein [Misgurnus anguillicaudatus]|uniref:uncharacterized protein n=1 Tax=Misgurnus anguillicaudatus TaxID=75329 RepID=UPI002435095A|nr:transcription factor Adf-1-like [Misgurnus anguillicaudatus]
MNTEMFLSWVYNHPELYDKNHREYKNNDKREALWKELAEKMGISADDVKAKWKNLRDTYTRRKREDSECHNEQAAKKRKPWKYMKTLEFLADFIETKSVHNNIEEHNDSGNEEATSSSGASTRSLENLTHVSAQRKRKQPETLDLLERYLENKQQRDRERQEQRDLRMEDDVGLFMQSLVPVIRRLSHDTRSTLKFQIHTLVHEAECRERDMRASSQQLSMSYHSSPPQTPPQYTVKSEDCST